jgi:pyruvate dehydrogenase E2 component (dihydrolipoamide acetyltransferase)
MPYEVVMPQLGMTMTKGAVLQWLKQAGDPVEKGEPLFEAQTDKDDKEVEAPCSGILSRILVPVETVVPVGSTIALITGEGESAAEAQNVTATADSTPAPAPVPGTASVAAAGPSLEPRPSLELPEPRRVSPRARRVAEKLGIDLARLQAWKERGRIVEADVRSYAEQIRAASATAPAASPKPSTVRSTIAERMTESFRTIPHFYLSVQADATGLKRLREDLVPAIERRHGVRLSYLDLMIKAAGLALAEHPEVNVAWANGAVFQRNNTNVGFAAQFSDRLLVPVIRDAADLPFDEIARVRAQLVEKGRGGKLTVADLEDASFTVSNLGSSRVDHFQAIITPPQSAILAAGRIAPRAVVVDGRIRARDTVWFTLSADHRILDGSVAARFLSSIVALVEAPYRLLLAGS